MCLWSYLHKPRLKRGTVEMFFCFFGSLESSVITVKQGIRETQLLGKVGASDNGLSPIILTIFTFLHRGDINTWDEVLKTKKV